MAWSSNQPYGNFSSHPNGTTTSQMAAPWLPLNTNFAKVNVQRGLEQIARTQQLINFRKANFKPNSIEKHGNYLFHYIFEGELVLERYFSRVVNSFRPRSDTNHFKGSDDDSSKNSRQDTGDQDTSSEGKVTSRARYVLFANFGRDPKVKDLRDKFHSGTIKVTSNLKRIRDFLYIKNLRLDSGEAIIAQVE